MKQYYVIHNLRSDHLAFSLYKKLIPKVAFQQQIYSASIIKNPFLLACIKWGLTLFFLF